MAIACPHLPTHGGPGIGGLQRPVAAFAGVRFRCRRSGACVLRPRMGRVRPGQACQHRAAGVARMNDSRSTAPHCVSTCANPPSRCGRVMAVRTATHLLVISLSRLTVDTSGAEVCPRAAVPVSRVMIDNESNPVCAQLVIRSSAPKSQHDRLSGWATREAYGCNPCRLSVNDLGVPGHVQPPCNTGAVASHQNQHVQRRKIPDSTRCRPGRRSQRLLYNFDTVGVTGSIPVSPTTAPPALRHRRPAPSRASGSRPRITCTNDRIAGSARLGCRCQPRVVDRRQRRDGPHGSASVG
jgi:hypothetical protein